MNDDTRRAQIRAEMNRIEKKYIAPLSAKLAELRKHGLRLAQRYQQAVKDRDKAKMTRIEQAILQVQFSVLTTVTKISPHQISYSCMQAELTGKPQKIAQVA